MTGMFFERLEEVVCLVVSNHHNQANLRHKLRTANTSPVYPCGLHVRCFTSQKLKTNTLSDCLLIL